MVNTNTSQPLTLTKGQQEAFDKLLRFISEEDSRVFILKGYAGTGKTTLIRKLVDMMKEQEIMFSLLASTGRAAKILANITDSHATTVHGEIYKYRDFNQDLETIDRQINETGVDKSGQIFLTFELIPVENNEDVTHVYVVDEASMISDEKEKDVTQSLFGSGKLLTDLLNYDMNGKFIFVGDPCQLPPIYQSFSPALSASYIETHFGIKVQEAELTEVMRQNSNSDLLSAAHKIRKYVQHVPQVTWGKLPLKGLKNVTIHRDLASMVNTYVDMIKKHGFNEATLLCKSNRSCDSLTQLVRPSFGRIGNLAVGDLLLVTQNNMISGFMNGDVVVVEQISEMNEQRAGLSFRKIEVKELFTQRKYSQLLIEDILYSKSTNLSSIHQKELFLDFYRRMKNKGIKQKDEEFKSKMRNDPYLNALRCVFGYALTCHKTQGGEWPHVFLDISPRNMTMNANASVYQWFYTAVTRAKVQLHVVDDFFIDH